MFGDYVKYKHLRYSNEKQNDEKLSDKIFDYIIYNLITNFTEKYCGASRIVLYSLPDAVSFYKRHSFKDFTELMCPNDERYLDGCIPLYYTF